MSTHIPCTVDTEPMARTMKSVSTHVTATTAAVVAMQSAVIQAEEDGATKVTNNVNRGFLSLMRSQISQKVANKQSRVEALLIQMGQQKRRLFNIKSTMEREYGRIAARYMKIFDSINRELASRIRQIDQPVFDLVNRHMATSTNRMNALSSWVAVAQSEGLADSQQILVSNMKNDTHHTLDSATNYLTDIGKQRIITNNILISNPAGNDTVTYSLPVVVFESVTSSEQIRQTTIKMPSQIASVNQDRIGNTIRENNNTLSWHDNTSSSTSSVAQAYAQMVNQSNASQRIKDMMQRMFENSDMKAL